MRPRVTLKLATSLDGRIATATGESQWITGEESRNVGNDFRDAYSAILVGVETVIQDNSRLTYRPRMIGTDERRDDPSQPTRIVLDSRLRTPPDAHVARAGTVIFTTAQDITPVGTARIVRVAPDGLGRPDPTAVLEKLFEMEELSVLIEGGGEVAASFLRAGVVDALEWFRAPILLGGEGRPCVAALALSRLSDAPRFRRLAVEPCGDDLWERYERL